MKKEEWKLFGRIKFGGSQARWSLGSYFENKDEVMTEEHKAQRRPCRPCRVGF